MRRILIVKMWALGDILMATPLLRALKKQWPDCHITWLAEAGHAGILRGNPLLDDVIAFDSRAWRTQFRYGQWAKYLHTSLALRRNLNARRFDAVVNLTAEKWWVVWFLAAPVRIGLFPRARPGLMGRLYTQAIPRTYAPLLHNTRHYLLPADALGIPGPHSEQMVLGIPDEDKHAADAFLQSQPGFDPSRPLYVLHPGTSQASKCWLPEQYAAVAAELTARGANVILTGSPAERALCEQIAASVPLDRAAASTAEERILSPGRATGVRAPQTRNSLPVSPDATGRRLPLSLSEGGGVGEGAIWVAAGAVPSLLSTAALVERAAAVVTGDTSVLHIASALNVPLVGIYGSTRPNDNAPLFGPQALLFDAAVPCAPCYKAKCPLTGDAFMQCQRAVTPRMVLDALDKLTRAHQVQSES